MHSVLMFLINVALTPYPPYLKENAYSYSLNVAGTLISRKGAG